MKGSITLSLFIGFISSVSARSTCNTAPANKGTPYTGPNGIEDATGDLWCTSHQSVCGLDCKGSVLVNDCTRTKDDAAQTSTFCWACTCADGTVKALAELYDGRYGGTIPTLTCAREYSNCLWEASNGPSGSFTQYMDRNCRKFSDCQNDAMNYINRYIDEPWSSVGSNPQPAATTSTPLPTASVQSSMAPMTIESFSTSASSSTKASDSSASSSSSSVQSNQIEPAKGTIESDTAGTTGRFTSSIILPTQAPTNTTQVPTTKLGSATPTPTQFTGEGVMVVPHLASIFGLVGLFAVSL